MNYFCCHRTLQIVFRGTKLEKKILEMEMHLLEPIHEADGCLPSVDVSNCPILYTMLTCLLALFYSSEIDPDQWQQIEVQLFQFLRERSEQRIAFLRTLIPLVCTAVQSELDNFRNTSLAEFVKINFGKNDHLWHLLISVTLCHFTHTHTHGLYNYAFIFIDVIMIMVLYRFFTNFCKTTVYWTDKNLFCIA